MSLPGWILAVVVVLGFAGYYGWAALAAFVGVVIYLIDDARHANEKCWCDGGKIWSPLTRKFRWHKACNRTGIRQSLSRRIFSRSRGNF